MAAARNQDNGAVTAGLIARIGEDPRKVTIRILLGNCEPAAGVGCRSSEFNADDGPTIVEGTVGEDRCAAAAFDCTLRPHAFDFRALTTGINLR